MSTSRSAAEVDREIAETLERRRSSPLRVACRTLPFGIRSCDWTVVGTLRAAEFSSRTRPGETAIVHPSTKSLGRWQVSFFDERGAVRDSLHPTAEDALRQVPPKRWKLKAF